MQGPGRTKPPALLLVSSGDKQAMVPAEHPWAEGTRSGPRGTRAGRGLGLGLQSCLTSFPLARQLLCPLSIVTCNALYGLVGDELNPLLGFSKNSCTSYLERGVRSAPSCGTTPVEEGGGVPGSTHRNFGPQSWRVPQGRPWVGGMPGCRGSRTSEALRDPRG